MTLNELRYLVAVAEHRHFGNAARACCISQPTLSTQIKKVEARLGVMLFERTNKSVRPTPLGDKVVARARKVLDEVDDIRALCQSDVQPLCGTRRLGLIPTLAPYLLPWLLPPLRRAYPALELVVVEDITARLTARLREHSLEVAMVALPVAESELIARPLFEEPFHVACPAGHPLARAETITLADLEPEEILYLADGHCLRDQALAICGGPANGQGGDFRAASLETLRQLVAAGLGFTLLPALAIPDQPQDLPGVVVRPFAGAASRRIGLICRSTYAHLGELDRLAAVVVAHLPPGVRALTAQ